MPTQNHKPMRPKQIYNHILAHPRRVHSFYAPKPENTRACLYDILRRHGEWITRDMSMATLENELIVVDRSIPATSGVQQ